MEEQKLVLQDGTYKYDDRTRQVSVSEEQLKKAGYVKLADDEQIVKMVELTKEKADLDEKIIKLKNFLNDDEKLSNIGKEKVNLLRCQLETMGKYSDILWARIDDLGGWE